jgi:hypothetical protein
MVGVRVRSLEAAYLNLKGGGVAWLCYYVNDVRRWRWCDVSNVRRSQILNPAGQRLTWLWREKLGDGVLKGLRPSKSVMVRWSRFWREEGWFKSLTLLGLFS